jgi:hypothetical protein
MRFFFCIAFFLLFCSEVIARQKEELRQQYNLALGLVQKNNYSQALAILEGVLIHPAIAVKEKSSLAEIQLLSLFTFARIYSELALIAYQAEEKNFEVIEEYFKKGIRIYQEIQTTPFYKKSQFDKINASTKHNLEYAKLALFQIQKEKQEQQNELHNQKDIPALIQELKEQQKKNIKQIEKLEEALPNYTTQKQKNQLLEKQLEIARKFALLQEKIKQKTSEVPQSNIPQ